MIMSNIFLESIMIAIVDNFVTYNIWPNDSMENLWNHPR